MLFLDFQRFFNEILLNSAPNSELFFCASTAHFTFPTWTTHAARNKTPKIGKGGWGGIKKTLKGTWKRGGMGRAEEAVYCGRQAAAEFANYYVYRSFPH